MTTQNVINGHFKNGMALVNQRMNLLQEQLDLLGEVLSVGCVYEGVLLVFLFIIILKLPTCPDS